MSSFLKFNQNFISEVHNSTREHTRNKIELLALDFLSNPRIEYSTRNRSNSLQLDDGIIRLGSKKSYRDSKSLKTIRKLSLMWIVISQIHSLIVKDIAITQRDLFYKVAHLGFRNQEELNELVLDISSTVDIPRNQLGIFTTTKGLVGGCLEWMHPIHTIKWHNLKCSFHGIPISGWMDWKEFNIRSNAVIILVVEKEGIYHRLMEDKFFEIIPSIIITGCGFPDLSTRMLLHRLYSVLNIPVVCLVDYNPFGYQIYFTYAFGSSRMGMETPQWSLPCIYWIGLHSEDLKLVKLKLEPFTISDEVRINSILYEIGLKREHFNELQTMAKRKEKAELETLYNDLGIEGFSLFVCRKILLLSQFHEEFQKYREYVNSNYNLKKEDKMKIENNIY